MCKVELAIRFGATQYSKNGFPMSLGVHVYVGVRVFICVGLCMCMYVYMCRCRYVPVCVSVRACACAKTLNVTPFSLLSLKALNSCVASSFTFQLNDFPTTGTHFNM